MQYQDRVQLVALIILLTLVAFIGVPNVNLFNAPLLQGTGTGEAVTTSRLQDGIQLTLSSQSDSAHAKHGPTNENTAETNPNNSAKAKKISKKNSNALRKKATEALLLAFIHLSAGGGAL